MNSTLSIINYLSFIAKGRCENMSPRRTLLFSFILILLINLFSNVLLSVTAAVTGEILLAQLKATPTVAYGIVAVSLMPIYEELMFRLFLQPTATKILISTSLIIGLFISYLVGHMYDLSPFLLVVVLPIAFSPLIALLIVTPVKKSLYPFKRVSVLSRLELAIRNDLRPAYYISAILFSAAHIAFQKLFYLMSTPVAVIMFINYFLVGLVLGNVRISKGIIYAIIIHAFLNLLVYLYALVR